jgi:DNA-binding MarR family transcriptional regulator
MSTHPPARPLAGATPEMVVADRLHSAAIHLLRRVARQDRASGIGPARLSALSVVVFAGPLTLGELARAEGVRPPTVTRVVRGLEDAGLVERAPGTGDRRTVLVRATPAGRRVLDAARRRRVDDLAARLRGLDDAEVALLGRAADLIEDAVARRVPGG